MSAGSLLRCLVAALCACAAMPVAAQLNCNVGVDFYPGGGIRSCRLNGHHTLYTDARIRVTCADGEVLEQYRDGRLKSCVIERTQVLGGTRCEAPARVEFEPDGRLRACRPG